MSDTQRKANEVWDVLFLKVGTPVKILVSMQKDGTEVYLYGYIYNFTPDGSKVGVRVVKKDGFSVKPYIENRARWELFQWKPRKVYR